jgi:putative glutamine amidotransferase
VSKPKIGVTSSALRSPAYYDPYLRALEVAGAEPVRLVGLAPEVATQRLAHLDGCLFPGGWDVDPGEYGEPPHQETELVDHVLDRMEIALVRRAMEARVPIFGICRGQQLINVALGGSLRQHVDGHDMHGNPRDLLAHPLTLEAGSEVADIVHEGFLLVNSLHHQAVKQLAPGLRVTAQSPDGIVEAVESGDRLVLAVQCHPEELIDAHPWARTLFERFVNRAGRSAESASRSG